MSLLHQAPARTFLKRVSLPILCFEEAGPRHFVLKQTFDVQTYHYQVRTYRDLKEWLSFWTVMEAFKNLQHFPSQPNKQSAVSSNCVQLSPSLSSMFLSAEFARRSLEGSWVAVTSPRACCTTGFWSTFHSCFLTQERGAGRGELPSAHCGCWQCLFFPSLTCLSAAFFPLCTVCTLRWRRLVLSQ